jgi:hypothetical protein
MDEPRPKKLRPNKLKKVTFIICLYAIIQARFDNPDLLVLPPWQVSVS